MTIKLSSQKSTVLFYMYIFICISNYNNIIKRQVADNIEMKKYLLLAAVLLATQPSPTLCKDKTIQLKGQIVLMESSTRVNNPFGEKYLDRLTLRLQDGTYAHCWLPKSYESQAKRLYEEFHMDIFEKPRDLETAVVSEINDSNVSDTRSPSTYKEWKQGKHFILKEFYINGKKFEF